MYKKSYMTAEAAFKEFMASHGHACDSILILDSENKFEKLPCPNASHNNKHFRYFFRVDSAGRHYGYIKCWAGACGGLEEGWVEENEEKGFRKLTSEEINKKLDEMREDLRIKTNDTLAKQADCAETALTRWNQGTDIGVATTPYVLNKQFTPYGLRKLGEILLVPLRDIHGKLWNIESIYANHKKFPMTGARVDGLFHQLGEIEPDKLLQLAEGIATACIVYEATNIPTICCRNANNLIKVAKSIKEKYPAIKIRVCADDDRINLEKVKQKLISRGKPIPKTLKNAGLITAKKISKEFLADITQPSINCIATDDELLKLEKPPSDFHDVFMIG